MTGGRSPAGACRRSCTPPTERRYSTLRYGKTPNPACGTIVAEVKNLANQGQAGLEYVTLSGVDYEGPYFLNAAGQPDGATTETSTSGRVVFFNVCSPGVLTVNPNTIAQLDIDEPARSTPPIAR